MEGVWFLERHTERDERSHKRGLMCWSHTSSPSLRTMVPARSTTAKTMTAQSSLLTDMVMLANAGSWCMNSSNCSVRGTEERQQRKWKRLREKGAERVTHRGDRRRCSWQASFALTSSQDGTSWRLGIKMDNHHSEVPAEESLSGEHKAEYQLHWLKLSRRATNYCWHFTRWPQREFTADAETEFIGSALSSMNQLTGSVQQQTSRMRMYKPVLLSYLLYASVISFVLFTSVSLRWLQTFQGWHI